MKDKISILRKDYRDLKNFQNAGDIASARSKLIIFVKKLIDDTNELIKQIGHDFATNRKFLNKKHKDLVRNTEVKFNKIGTVLSQDIYDDADYSPQRNMEMSPPK